MLNQFYNCQIKLLKKLIFQTKSYLDDVISHEETRFFLKKMMMHRDEDKKVKAL